MKKFCVLVGFVLALLAVTNVQAGINDGLVAYYPFDGDTLDASGYGNDGTAYNGISFVDGIVGQAVNFDGTDDFIKISDNYSLDFDQSFSISVWINPKRFSDSTGTYESNFISKWYSSPHVGDFFLLLGRPDSSGEVTFAVSNNDAGFERDSIKTSPNSIQLDKWSHIVATFENGLMKIYVNGQLSVTKTSQTVLYTQASEYTYDDIYIGTLWNNKYEYKGDLDELYLYNRALTEDEIKDLYFSNLTPSDALENLVNDSLTLNLQEGILNSLDSKLESALNALDDVNENNDSSAINSMYAFINSAEAQSGKKISVEDAENLIAIAKAIIANLESN